MTRIKDNLLLDDDGTLLAVSITKEEYEDLLFKSVVREQKNRQRMHMSGRGVRTQSKYAGGSLIKKRKKQK